MTMLQTKENIRVIKYIIEKMISLRTKFIKLQLVVKIEDLLLHSIHIKN